MGRESSLSFLSYKGNGEYDCCSESKMHKAVTDLPVSSPSRVPAVCFSPALNCSTEKVRLSFRLLLGDLFTTSQRVQSHAEQFSRTSWQSELQDIFQTSQFLLTEDFSVRTERHSVAMIAMASPHSYKPACLPESPEQVWCPG